ncbi:hypothetical protein OG874_02590 [Nocardia sp. NBC_00565]|uniref:hypothetical protein n=1 Tax=Nocardia sp. NBC_00565 TaxID=2975993 RepID=UPI002E817850|nr:hypothetical protein [Nocardia sp. NBC_00565]WUC04125.1 hypothetical protein OG874_02590 [Nocardia sp. NBC_00565]
MSEDTILTPPTICGRAEVELAHQQMRRHRACRIERCAWKWAAYYTLVRHGRIAPQELSPRERAHRRGIAFPAETIGGCLPIGTPGLGTFQQVLDGLTQLALPPTCPGDDRGR